MTLREFGTKSFAEAVEPAIELADGYPIDEMRADAITQRAATSRSGRTSKRVFLPDGRCPAARRDLPPARPGAHAALHGGGGEEGAGRGRQPRQGHRRRARLLLPRRNRPPHRRVLRSRTAACCATRTWRPSTLEPEEPVSTTFHGYTVYKPGFWSQGPAMIEALNILEGFNLADMGLNSADYIHTLVEALKLAYADRDTYYGDPKFVKIPTGAAALEGVRRRAAQADRRTQASLDFRPGERASRIRPSILSTSTSRATRSTTRCWPRTPPAWTPSTRTAWRFRSRPRAPGCPR